MKQNTMTVQVTHATGNTWYEVGDVYKVLKSSLGTGAGEYYPLPDDKNTGILREHCEIIEENQPKCELKFPLYVKCINNTNYEYALEKGKVYTAVNDYHDSDYILKDVPHSWDKGRFVIVEDPTEEKPISEVCTEVCTVEEKRTIDSHYNFDYVLKESDIEAGKIKVDPYFVAKQWRLGSKDDTGVLFHCLKNISRYSDKNSKEREIKALYLQIKRLAELENVSLNEMVLEILDKA